MKPTALMAALAVALTACQQSVQYAQFEGYMQAARGVWPLAIEGAFPEPFTNEDADRLHESITSKTGLRPEAFHEYRGFFLAAARELERNRTVAALAGVDETAFERGLPNDEARSIVRGYLEALALDSSTRRFWIGGEPGRTFDRLLDHDDPVPVAPRPTRVEARGPRGGTVLCWAFVVHCRVADLRGRESGQRFVFFVTGVSGSAGILQVRAA